MEKDKQITIVAAAQIILAAVWLLTDFMGLTRFLASSGFLLIGYGGFYFIQYKELSDLRGSIQQNNSPSTLSMEDIRDVAKTWSDREYRGSMQINWNFADYSTKPLHDWVNGNDELYSITGAISGNRTSVQLFILASERDVKEHKLVRDPDQYRRPFRYSDYYQEYKRKSKNRVMENSGQNMQRNMYPNYSGMPAMPQQPQPQPSTDEEDDGDE